MVTRKNFIHLASMSIGGLVLPNILLSSNTSVTQNRSAMQSLAQQALDAACSGGATYADVRICTRPKLSISTRVLVNGAWGFASVSALSADAANECVKKALGGALENKLPPAKGGRVQYNLQEPYDVWVCASLRRPAS